MDQFLKKKLHEYDRETVLSKRVDIAVDISTYCRNHSHYKQALEIIHNTLRETERDNDQQGTAKAFKELSLIHYTRLIVDKALDFGFRALSIFKRLKRDKDISEVLCNIGVYYNALNLEEKGAEYFQQSLQHNKNNIAAVINLGEFSLRRGEYRDSIDHFEKAINLAREQGKPGDEAFAHKSIGEVQNARGEFNEAIRFFNESLKLLEVVNEDLTRALVYIGLGSSYLNIGEIQRALTFTKKAHAIAQKMDNNEIYWFCYTQLGEIYEKMEDFKEASTYLKKSIHLHEKLYSAKIARRIAAMESQYAMEKKELETRQLLERSARLATIGVMTAGITHEINQPLNSIVINADGILFKDDRDQVLPPLYRKSVEKVFSSAQRIDQIIKHIRIYWNAGDEMISACEIAVNDCIRGALGFLHQQCHSHGIDLITELSPAGPGIIGNKVHLEQITVNLITNAIHALDQSEKKSKWIKVTSRVDNQSVVIAIEDNGIGLNVDDSKDIFDPFFSTQHDSGGMGLGLSIVKNYVNQMNGEVRYDNRQGEGVTFSISFPLLPEEQ